MSVWRYVPWKSAARRLARRHGFVDPVRLFDRMREFAQPSEVGEPIELLRAGASFHARGLLNRAIQFNLDWVWPFWIERQFNPEDDSFVPRAFSFSHINLTHRNWTAVGLLDVPSYPIVDPRGLVTPQYDGWSLDFWVVDENGVPLLLPSRAKACDQRLEAKGDISVTTRLAAGDVSLATEVSMDAGASGNWCVIRASAAGPAAARLVVAIRPYNPEGVSFIDTIDWDPAGMTMTVNEAGLVRFAEPPQRVAMSCYSGGDVLQKLRAPAGLKSMACRAGMATAAAVFPVGHSLEIRVLVEPAASHHNGNQGANGENANGSLFAVPVNGAVRPTLRDEVGGYATMDLRHARWAELYDSAVATLVLHAPGEVYPGPYTYKRFWYRDAAFILNALAAIGAQARCRKALDRFPRGQLSNGYFRSQEGEWDSNGEVLWIIERCAALDGESVRPEWHDMVERAGRWILGKRMSDGAPHPGLLPAGFSAEHLGLNDFYYWDDFWGVAGLKAAARILHTARPGPAREFDEAADQFLRTIESSIERSAVFHECGAVPAAPDRRMDSGAIGSLVADYPLQLVRPGDSRIMKTAEWLMAKSFVRGAFFQNMIHSGLNAYLTLHVAQVLLRAGDRRAVDAIEAVANLASQTGQWPEAIHPRTLGGCMGDGQHVWAAAEWVLAMRNLFVREERSGLVLAAGLRPEWLRERPARFGPAATPFGTVTVTASAQGEAVQIELAAQWRGPEPEITLGMAGFRLAERQDNCFRLLPLAA